MSHIKTYARIKPSRNTFEDVDVVDNDLLLRVPDAVQYYSSVSRGRSTVTHQFHFDHVFEQRASQQDVFDTVALDIVDAFVNGYNGTIFAYGQTGTGKTYTVEGGSRQYSERGLASRAVSRIYEALEHRDEEVISVKVSFLEIYQEVGYDLLSPAARGQWLVTPFPRVTVMEGTQGSCLIRNLSCHLAASEEVAQNLLIQGQANRTVAETPVNQRSSRSHAVFSIFLSTQKPNSDIVVRSKLHLVDLAGSERVAKTGVDGQQLNEAKSINLSLHHLESVIIALQASPGEKKPARKWSSDWAEGDATPDLYSNPKHVPYRNSLLTMLLRDSLGGNCLTAMVATVSLEWQNLGETISTCRFAQRVACISNSIHRNEEIDDKSLVKVLRKKIAELETEITFLKLKQGSEEQGEQMSGKLSEEDREKCRQIIQEYVTGRLRDPIAAGVTSPFKFRECLKILKTMVKEPTVSVNRHKECNFDVSSRGPSSGVSRRTDRSIPSSDSYQTVTTADNGPRLHNGEQIAAGDSQPRFKVRGRSQSMSNLDAAVLTTAKQREANLTRANSDGPSAGCWGSGKPPRRRPQSAQPVTSPGKSPYARKPGRRHKCTGEEEVPRSASYTDIADVDLNNSKVVQLVSLVDDLEGKDRLVEAQLAELRAHMTHLRATDGGQQDLAEAAHLERRLRKRQAWLQGKVEKVYQKLQRFSKQEEDHDEKDKDCIGFNHTWQEKFGQHRKNDGSLNTREVFEKLQTDIDRKAKVHFKLADDSPGDKELDMREEATRQKLSHFRKLLAKSDRDMTEEESHQPKQLFSKPPGMSTSNHSRARALEMDRRRGTRRHEQVNGTAALTLEDLDIVDLNGCKSRGVADCRESRLDSLTQLREYSTPTNGHVRRHSSQPQLSSSDASLSSPNAGHYTYSNSTDPIPDVNPQLYTPSQYINHINKQDVFDAHQMGLYSKTFESALHSMLEKDNARLFSHHSYDQFARRSSCDPHISVGHRNGLSQNTQGAGSSPMVQPYSLPSADRQVRRPDERDIQPTDSVLNGWATSWSQSGYAEEDTDSKVKATPDNEREMSFMSKAKEQKDRISKIRQAQHSARVIQKAWRRHYRRTRHKAR